MMRDMTTKRPERVSNVARPEASPGLAANDNAKTEQTVVGTPVMSLAPLVIPHRSWGASDPHGFRIALLGLVLSANPNLRAIP